jgi:deazaflavin-dependent oxidoreductase (nitroreductase family)
MHIPYFMRRVNRVVTNPVVGTVAWLVPPLAIVHHEGRRSGRHYRTPVVAFRTADGFVIPMTYGWDVDWARNLRAAKRGEVVQLGRRLRVRNPRIVDGERAKSRLPLLVRPLLLAARFPGYVLVDV